MSPRQANQAEVDLTELVEAARSSASMAYCPYSRFRVGAAVLTELGVFVGCNVENASYGLTLCAERVATFNAIAAGSRELRALALSCPDVKGSAIELRMPCGACRQVMMEFGSEDLKVVVDGGGRWTLKELLPVPFMLGSKSTRQPRRPSTNHQAKRS